MKKIRVLFAIDAEGNHWYSVGHGFVGPFTTSAECESEAKQVADRLATVLGSK